MHKLRVGVLMGGKSIEHEVSFNSGRTVCDHLDTNRFTIIPIYQTKTGDLYLLPWHFLHRGKTSDFSTRLVHEAPKVTLSTLKEHVDFIFIATHGRYAEDGTLQGALEVLEIPYLGSKVFGSALGMDKALQREFLKNHGIKVPKGFVVYPHACSQEDIEQKIAHEALTFPLIIKPHKEGSSLGMGIAHTKEELMPLVHKAISCHEGVAQAVIIEEKIIGMEFSAIVITDYRTGQPITLPITEIVPEAGSHFFDYEQKYMPGRARKFTPARCSREATEKIHQTIITLMHALDFTTMARVDGFLTPEGEVIIIDPNSLSGMGPTSFLFNQGAQYGMGHRTLINHLINAELAYYHMLETTETHQSTAESSHRMRIGVLLGGQSHEKEISLESGRNICYKLSPEKYAVSPIFVAPNFDLYTLTEQQLVLHATHEIMDSVEPEQRITWDEIPTRFDFIFIGLHGGKGEDGCVQGMLEMLGMPYNGSSVLASALCNNKFKVNDFLHRQGFCTPQSALLSKKAWEISALTSITLPPFPLIMKPHNDGCSIGVQKIKNEEELAAALPIFFEQFETAMLEEYMSGMELTVGIIGNHRPFVLPASHAKAAKEILSIQEKFLPGEGENQTPATLSISAQKLIQSTLATLYTLLNLKGYARIDCFYQTGTESPTGFERLVILEINTLPGMTPATVLFHQAAEVGIKPMEFIDLIVQLGLEEHKGIPASKALERLAQRHSQML